VHTFVPGDPEIEVLKDLFERENMSTENKTHLLFALGKAHDEIGEYAEASSYYERANKDMAGRLSYDPPAHRKGIQDVKKAFREPCAAEDPKEGKPTPIFVVGMSRSGKTLVESLLSQHADVFAAGESREWTGAMRKVLDKNAITGAFPTYMDSLTGAHIREIGEIYVKGVSKLSRDARFFVDTMPGNYPYLGLIFQALPWAKVIYCRRDPLDNCVFVYFQRYKARHGYSYDLENTAAYYGDYQDVMAHWHQLYGDRILGVRYEDLVGNPTDSAERIYEYCGLAYDPAAIRADFRTDEIGHWNHYEPYLGALRKALGLAQ
jgi:tetratricopeptide (TPR) repeat protein